MPPDDGDQPIIPNIPWNQIFEMMPNGIPVGDGNYISWQDLLPVLQNVNANFPSPGGGNMEIPTIPWNQIFEMMPNGIPLGNGNSLSWLELLQGLANDTQMGTSSIPWNQILTNMPNGIPLDDGTYVSWQVLSQISPEDLQESLMAAMSLRPDQGGGGQGESPSLEDTIAVIISESGLLPPETEPILLAGVSELIGLVSGTIPDPISVQLSNIPWPQLFDMFPTGIRFADGEISSRSLRTVLPNPMKNHPSKF